MKPIIPDKEAKIIDSYNKKKLGQLKKRRNLRKTKIFVSRARFFARILCIGLKKEETSARQKYLYQEPGFLRVFFVLGFLYGF